MHILIKDMILINFFAYLNNANVPTIVTVLNIINAIFWVIINICYFHQHFHAVVGFVLKAKQYPKAVKKHKYGYLIAARNESAVIGELIDSIYAQNYDKDLMRVFVIADNCNDDTAIIAKEHGAIVFERKNDILVGKGYALDFGLKNILEDENYKDIEAFFIFDADNILDKEFTNEMNNAFDSGVKVCTGFRDSKNFGESWVSAGQSLSFYRECLLIHNSRCNLNMGTYVSGTGFYVAREIIEKNEGWKHFTLIEDIEFSIQCMLDGVKIKYCESALFYDEQPVTLKYSLKQRLRWCKGALQCVKKYETKMTKKLFKTLSPTTFELLMHVTPLPIITFMWSIVYLLVGLGFAVFSFISWQDYLHIIFGSIIAFLISLLVAIFLQGVLCLIKRRKHLKISKGKCVLYSFTFPIFMFFYLPLLFVALFKKVKWVEIPHHSLKSTQNELEEK